MVKRLFSRGTEPDPGFRLEAERGRILVEESREIVVVLDDSERVVAASRRARELVEGLEEGGELPAGLRGGSELVVPYQVDGRRETLVYLQGQRRTKSSTLSGKHPVIMASLRRADRNGIQVVRELT